MGLILELFQKDRYEKRYGNYTPDFQNPQIDSPYQKTYDEVTEKLSKSRELIEEVSNYRSNQNDIRQTMTNPSAENKKMLFEKLGKRVERLKAFYNFCKEDVVTMFQELRRILARVEEEKLEDEEKLKRQEVWSKLLAELISFVLQWDQHKMREPALLNDYSYYKREFVKLRASLPPEECEEFLQLAGVLSFWLAQSMPMCKMLGESLKDDNSRKLLRDISAFCCSLVKNEKFTGSESQCRENEILCLRCAVGCIILYDRASEGMGAFASKTFETKTICKTLATYAERRGYSSELCDNLKNVIRYGSQSFQQYGSKDERRYIG